MDEWRVGAKERKREQNMVRDNRLIDNKTKKERKDSRPLKNRRELSYNWASYNMSNTVSSSLWTREYF